MPLVVLFAGPNGSGKSTITAEYQQQHWFPTRYLNADELARVRAESDQEERERAAFREARQLRQRYREEGVSFAFETVFSHPSTLLDMQRLRAAGFTLHLVYVTIATSIINAARVRRRVLIGGHDVPLDKIHARYRRSLHLMPRAVEEADIVDIFDNSGVEPKLCLIRSQHGMQREHPDMPEYLQDALLRPLMERHAERAQLAVDFPHIALPEEAAGVYTGSVLQVGPHYVVQECSDGIFRHDCLLLSQAIKLTSGQTVTVHYNEGALT